MMWYIIQNDLMNCIVMHPHSIVNCWLVHGAGAFYHCTFTISSITAPKYQQHICTIMFDANYTIIDLYVSHENESPCIIILSFIVYLYFHHIQLYTLYWFVQQPCLKWLSTHYISTKTSSIYNTIRWFHLKPNCPAIRLVTMHMCILPIVHPTWCKSLKPCTFAIICIVYIFCAIACVNSCILCFVSMYISIVAIVLLD